MIEDLFAPNSLVLPKFELRKAAELYGAKGAFAGQINTIYIAQEFLQEDVNNISEIVAVLLEELGHAIDLQFNKTDTKGDEGKLVSTLVQEGELNQAELQQIKI